MPAGCLEPRRTKSGNEHGRKCFLYSPALREGQPYASQLLPRLRLVHRNDQSLQQPRLYIPARCSSSVFWCFNDPWEQLSFWIPVWFTSCPSRHRTSMATIPQGASQGKKKSRLRDPSAHCATTLMVMVRLDLPCRPISSSDAIFVFQPR